MQKAILTLILLASTGANATENILCSDYERKVKSYGTSSITGLKLVPDEKGNAKLQQLHFKHSFDQSMTFRTSQGTRQFPIFNLTETEEQVEFFTKPLSKTGKRNGERIVLKKLPDYQYELTLYDRPTRSHDFDTGKTITSWNSKMNLAYGEEKTTFLYKSTEESRKAIEAFQCIPDPKD
ncbi:hypothetical protein [Vibrio harveyi]|uniref:hypothetical protein n=1 Tax=Vibrio harveyi TaxID=669 RepID=UPI0023808C08|nr:hypothetical protein [Vibrio harveyi]